MDNFPMFVIAAIAILSTLVQVYGIYTAYMKKWWLGALALLFPQFAFIIGAAKLLKKEILA